MSFTHYILCSLIIILFIGIIGKISEENNNIQSSQEMNDHEPVSQEIKDNQSIGISQTISISQEIKDNQPINVSQTINVLPPDIDEKLIERKRSSRDKRLHHRKIFYKNPFKK